MGEEGVGKLTHASRMAGARCNLYYHWIAHCPFRWMAAQTASWLIPFDNADNKTATAITNESLENYIHMYMRPDRNFAEQWPESDGESQIGGRRDPLSTDYALITRLSNPGSTILPIRIVIYADQHTHQHENGIRIWSRYFATSTLFQHGLFSGSPSQGYVSSDAESTCEVHY